MEGGGGWTVGGCEEDEEEEGWMEERGGWEEEDNGAGWREEEAMFEEDISFWEDFGVFCFIMIEDLFVDFWDFECGIFESSFESCREEKFFLAKK